MANGVSHKACRLIVVAGCSEQNTKKYITLPAINIMMPSRVSYHRDKTSLRMLYAVITIVTTSNNKAYAIGEIYHGVGGKTALSSE